MSEKEFTADKTLRSMDLRCLVAGGHWGNAPLTQSLPPDARGKSNRAQTLDEALDSFESVALYKSSLLWVLNLLEIGDELGTDAIDCREFPLESVDGLSNQRMRNVGAEFRDDRVRTTRKIAQNEQNVPCVLLLEAPRECRRLHDDERRDSGDAQSDGVESSFGKPSGDFDLGEDLKS